jgi:hypothetical protein
MGKSQLVDVFGGMLPRDVGVLNMNILGSFRLKSKVWENSPRTHPLLTHCSLGVSENRINHPLRAQWPVLAPKEPNRAPKSLIGQLE